MDDLKIVIPFNIWGKIAKEQVKTHAGNLTVGDVTHWFDDTWNATFVFSGYKEAILIFADLETKSQFILSYS